jgi:hypothetical protein
MKLQEQINRIHSILGISESKLNLSNDSRMVQLFNHAVENVGLSSAIKLFGGYEQLKDYFEKTKFSRENKIEFIKYVYSEIGGTSFSEVYENPIHYPSGDETHEEIAYMTSEVVIVDVYGGHEYDTHVESFEVPYEDLSDDIINEIFDITMKVAEESEII